eukprot:TRINITY_DN93307_c0_g1_i1.p1 TRINITY_DN93307_c0_g1~~TRINITY_DN93307_c0_g1_i1.p1  ORF type:complete len:352 (+),score=44.37 TRINITY_DN93307_c0_g1_i1:76-1131(+)
MQSPPGLVPPQVEELPSCFGFGHDGPKTSGSIASAGAGRTGPAADGTKEDPDLEEGATSIMLRSLSLHLKLDGLLMKLDEIAEGKYDFVYLPQNSRRKNTNIALAFINFVDHASAKRAYHVFLHEAASKKPNASSRLVCQAHVQGLAANLAYFVATAGLHEANNPHAPQVFKDGVRVENLLDAINEHVTCELLVNAQKLVNEPKESKSYESKKKVSGSQCSRSNASSYSGHSGPSNRSGSSSTITVSSARSSHSHASRQSVQSKQSRQSRRSYDDSHGLRQNPTVPQGRLSSYTGGVLPMPAKPNPAMSMGLGGSMQGHAGYAHPHPNYMDMPPAESDCSRTQVMPSVIIL